MLRLKDYFQFDGENFSNVYNKVYLIITLCKCVSAMITSARCIHIRVYGTRAFYFAYTHTIDEIYLYDK